MPAKKSSKKTSRVMDVSRPGKTAPSASSRPIIVGHKPAAQDPMVNEDKKMPENEPEEHKIDVKRTSPKVIAPLSPTEDLTASTEADQQTNPVEEPAADQDLAEETPLVPDEQADQPEVAETEDIADETKKEDAQPTKEPKESKEKGSSIVDAIAGQAAKSKDKKDNKKNEELQKRLAEIEKLVEDKKYFVKTSNTTKKERKTRWAVLLLSLLLLVAGYLAIDAQLVKNDYWLPHHFFEERAEEKATDETAESKLTPADDVQKEADEAPDETAEEASSNSAAAQVRENDLERKNELKNLQVKLEAYFNDNGVYPESLAVFELTADESTDPKGMAYSYVPADDFSTFVLTADLENDKDPDANADGNYVIRSIN